MMRELTNAMPLQIVSPSAGKLLKTQSEQQQIIGEGEMYDVEGAIILSMTIGKSAPMDALHALVSHQNIDINPTENLLIQTEDIENKEERENDSNMQIVCREAGISPMVATKIREGKGKDSSCLVPTRVQAKRMVKSGSK